MADATAIDAGAREITIDDGERLPYDSLIVACGARTSYFGRDEWADVTHGLKSLDDAVRLRNRIYSCFEQAERLDGDDERAPYMTFVIVGGGPTGVEVAGSLAILRRHDLHRQYRRNDPRQARVILLDAGPAAGRSVQREAVGQGVEVPCRSRRRGPPGRPGDGDRRRRRDVRA